MLFSKLLALISAITSGAGSILIAYSVVFKMTPELIADLSSDYWGFSPKDIENYCSNKADTLQGISLVILAVFVELAGLLIQGQSWDTVLRVRDMLLIIASLLVLVIWIVVFFQREYLPKLLKKAFMAKLRTMLISDLKHLIDYIERIKSAKDENTKISWSNSLRRVFDQFIRLSTKVNFKDSYSTPSTKLTHLSNILGVTIPKELDLENLDKYYYNGTAEN